MLRILVAVAALGATGAPARAAETVAPEVARKAREVYARGEHAFAAHAYADAEAAFREVYLLMQAPEVVFDIALTLEKQHKWADAADAYDNYLADSARVKDRKRLEARVAELRARADRQKEMDTHVAAPDAAPAATTPGNQVLPLAEEPGKLRGRDAGAVEPAHGPVHKKWWFWVAIVGGAVVVAGVATGVALGTASASTTPSPTTFPDFGPAAGPTVSF